MKAVALLFLLPTASWTCANTSVLQLALLQCTHKQIAACYNLHCVLVVVLYGAVCARVCTVANYIHHRSCTIKGEENRQDRCETGKMNEVL